MVTFELSELHFLVKLHMQYLINTCENLRACSMFIEAHLAVPF